ncbi:hypothetical protein ACRRRS_22010 (plasmid) [Brucella anthropi]|uniref:hypothetical protein n=1 Tax=Brucella anthropi TaxID=529 RepID=UPI003D7C7966
MANELKPFLTDMLSMSTGTDGHTLQIHFSRPVTMDDRLALMDAHNAACRRIPVIPSSLVNDADIRASDTPYVVVKKLDAAFAMSSPTPILPGNSFTPTHRHIKTGGEYEYVGGARIQSEVPLNDMDQVAVYLGRDGDLWARRQCEFNTSRFESLPEAPLPPEDPYIAELEAENKRLKDAVRNLIENRFDTYKARNGRQCSIEGDDGEKCWIVSFDDMAELETALNEVAQS